MQAPWKEPMASSMSSWPSEDTAGLDRAAGARDSRPEPRGTGVEVGLEPGRVLGARVRDVEVAKHATGAAASKVFVAVDIADIEVVPVASRPGHREVRRPA